MSEVSLLYDSLAVIVAALMNENKRAIKVTTFIYQDWVVIYTEGFNAS